MDYSGVTPINLETIKEAMQKIKQREMRVPKYIKVSQTFMDTVISKIPIQDTATHNIFGFAPLYGLPIVLDDSVSDYEVVYDDETEDTALDK